MAPKCFLLRRSTPPSPESTSCPHSQSITSLLFAPRSTSPNKTSLNPSITGGLVAIGILALLSAVGMGLAIHIHYCRQSDCAACNVILCLARSRGSRSAPGSFVELSIEPLIMISIQCMTTILCLNKSSSTHTRRLRVMGYFCSGLSFRVIGYHLGDPFPPSHRLPHVTSTDHT